MSEAIALAKIGAVYADGVSLIFEGQTNPSQKHYKINTAVPFQAGDRVKVVRDGGTYIAEYVVGPRYTGSGGSGGGGTAGVTSWNGRTGAVMPQAGDYDIPSPATAAPQAPAGTAAVGSSKRYAREDHVHPRQSLSVSDLDTEALYRALRQRMIDEIYPVDAYFLSDDDTDPGLLFGGTWRQVESPGPAAFAWRRTDGTDNDRISAVVDRAVVDVSVIDRAWVK